MTCTCKLQVFLITKEDAPLARISLRRSILISRRCALKSPALSPIDLAPALCLQAAAPFGIRRILAPQLCPQRSSMAICGPHCSPAAQRTTWHHRLPLMAAAPASAAGRRGGRSRQIAAVLAPLHGAAAAGARGTAALKKARLITGEAMCRRWVVAQLMNPTHFPLHVQLCLPVVPCGEGGLSLEGNS